MMATHGGDDGAREAGARPEAIAAIDTARIVAMDRSQLETLITRLYSLRDETPLISFAGITDDELRDMARRLRADDATPRP